MYVIFFIFLVPKLSSILVISVLYISMYQIENPKAFRKNFHFFPDASDFDFWRKMIFKLKSCDGLQMTVYYVLYCAFEFHHSNMSTFSY